MTITETITGEGITMHLELDILGQYHGAQLDGRARYAIIDGLLWWAIQHQVDAFTKRALETFSILNGPAMNTAESLDHYVWHLDWANTGSEQARRILTTVRIALVDMEPLAMDAPMKELLQQLQSTARILADRMDHAGEALHGVERIMKHQDAA